MESLLFTLRPADEIEDCHARTAVFNRGHRLLGTM
jgi:hypothetical protein